MSLKIYVHTYNRLDKQKTLERLDAIKEHVWLVIQHRERKLYDNIYDSKRMIVLPKHIQTLSPTRQWLLENADTDKMVMADDDLYFYRRRCFSNHHSRKTTNRDVWRMYHWLDWALDHYMHAGITHRYFNTDEKIIDECCEMSCFLGYRKEVNDLGCRFDRVPLAQDHDMTLQLLEKGYPNLVNFYFSYSQLPQAPGGVSDYRTFELLEQVAHEMARLHPGTVKVVKKHPKTNIHWKKLDPSGKGERVAFTCKWKKAFEMSKGLV